MKPFGLRDVGNVAIYRFERLLLRLKVVVQFDGGLVERYQPNPFRASAAPNAAARACADRFEAFSGRLPAGEPLSCLDVGCNLGYFTFRMAERGGLCIGLDWGRNEIGLARALASLHKIHNALFAEYTLTEDSARALPEADVVLCLSIYHHWARKLGEAGAGRIMAALAARTRRYLVFETGQHDESEAAWAPALAFMGEDCDAWICRFLTNLGFETVECVGRFPTSVSSGRRGLYVASREAMTKHAALFGGSAP